MVTHSADYRNQGEDDFVLVRKRTFHNELEHPFHVRFDDILTVGGTTHRDGLVSVTIRDRQADRLLRQP